MGNCVGKGSNPEDRLIGAKLKQIQGEEAYVLKILLLGTGDSGKTTIFKQMKILYGGGVGTDDLDASRRPLFQDLVKGAQTIIEAAGLLPGSSDLVDPKTIAASEELMSVDPDRIRSLAPEVALAISTLWGDKEVREIWARRSEIQVTEAWGRFAAACERYPRWGGPDWLPTIEDYLYTRSRTTGSITEKFVVDKRPLQLVDVGGQRNERRKWIYVFGGVTAVLFVAAISEYDQRLFEEEEKNRLDEALELFDKMVNSDWFKETNMILFLNKSDIFEEKLCRQKIPLNRSGLFPSAPKTFNKDIAIKWLKEMFISRAQNESLIFPHVTTATDTKNMRFVLDACKFILLRRAVGRVLL